MDQEEIERIMATPGKARGVVFTQDRGHILQKAGEQALKKIQEQTERLGHPIDYKNIKPLAWYPIRLWVVHLLVVKQALNWGDKEIFTMGNEAPKFSILVKMRSQRRPL